MKAITTQFNRRNVMQYIKTAIGSNTYWLRLLLAIFCIGITPNMVNAELSVKSIKEAKEIVVGKRIALVVGNSSYSGGTSGLTHRLRNATNDAEDMAAALRRIGFAVTLLQNASQPQMNSALHNFGKDADNAEVALYYFSGNGVRVEGNNYMLPVDREFKNAEDVRLFSINTLATLKTMEAANANTKIAIFDTCLNDYFKLDKLTRGFTRMFETGGTLLAFSALPDQTASDGTGRNSPYTEALLKHLETPGLYIEEIFDRTRRDVMRTTRTRQTPYIESTLGINSLVFKPDPEQNKVTQIPNSAPVSTMDRYRTLGIIEIPQSGPNKGQYPLYEGSYALVIGVSDYDKWKPLPGVKRDMVAVADVLREHGFIVSTKLNPNRDELDATLRNFVSLYGQKPRNRLLIYFAGHGHTLTTGLDVPLAYLVPKDAPVPGIDLGPFQAAAYDLDAIESLAKTLGAKHALFIFDSCFSGALIHRGTQPPDHIINKMIQPVRQFITSGSEKQVVPDDSIFRHRFVQALRFGSADLDGDGYITGTELGMHLENKVTDDTRRKQTPLWGKIRHPALDLGDFIFLAPEKPNGHAAK
jgi:uncharacterized caspase-like protein